MQFFLSRKLQHLSLVLVLTLACLSENGAAARSLPKNASIPAVLVFGDSIVDPGNNNNLKTIAKSNFPPYGRDLLGGRPTGRFSNGRIPPDLIAEAVGIKKLLPAYLDPNLQLQDLLTGVSFGSGASGYDPISAQTTSTLSLSDQLNLFKEYLARIKSGVGEDRAATIISNSLYIICTGSNDITNTYGILPIRRYHYDINSYTDLMVSFASTFYQELYELGARRLGIVSLPPLGCLPSQRSTLGGLNRECAVSENEAASLANSKLSSEIDSLNQKFPGAAFVYLDIYNPLLSMIQNPAPYGFEVATKGCCGTGTFEASIFCNELDEGTCSDASKYIFWDGYHPTENAYKLIVYPIVKNNLHNFLGS